MTNDEIIKEEFKPLRDEIIGCQKARTDFLQFKLLGIAALASVGFGLKLKDSSMDLKYLFAIIPFFCVYVDTICYHNNIRVLVIAEFLKSIDEPYETFILRLKNNMNPPYPILKIFEMEDGVLRHSTYLLSGLIFVYGLVLNGLFVICKSLRCPDLIKTLYEMIFCPDHPYSVILHSFVMLFSGLCGLVLSWFSYRKYQNYVKKLHDTARNINHYKYYIK